MQRNQRRLAFCRLLSTLAFGGVCGGSCVMTEQAYGQLRTGREGAREFYQETPVPKASRSKSPTASTQSPPADSGVVLASCTACAQGVAHSHGRPLRSPEPDVVVSEYQEDAGTSEGYAVDPTYAPTYAPDDGCDACGCMDGGCDCYRMPHLNIRLAFPFAHAFQRLTARMEAATFYGTDANIPGLVRTADVGVAGSSDLFGGTVPMESTSQGFRGEVGWQCRNDVCSGIQVRFFDAGSNSLIFDSVQTNNTSVVRPYFDPNTNQQESISILQPGVSTGSILAHATSTVYGGDLLLQQNIHRSHYGSMDFLAGYQTACLSESISLDSTTVSGSVLRLQDRFDTNNRFNAGVIGISGITRSPNWSLSGMFKLGLGNMDRYVGIAGFQEITVAPPPVSSSVFEGLLARSTNSGMYNNNNTFIVSPEVNVTLGYRLTRNLEFSLGYNYLGLPKVARAADQIDPQLASNLNNPLTGPTRPSFTFTESNFALHSLNYGLQFRY